MSEHDAVVSCSPENGEPCDHNQWEISDTFTALDGTQYTKYRCKEMRSDVRRGHQTMTAEHTLFDIRQPTKMQCRTCLRPLHIKHFRVASKSTIGRDTECTECRNVREIVKVDGRVWPVRTFNHEILTPLGIDSPSGVLRGRKPQINGDRNGELNVAAVLARTVNGLAEVTIRGSRQRADVCTNTTVWEVKQAKDWVRGWQQLRDYATATGLKPALALYGKGSRMEPLEGMYPLSGEPLATIWLYYADDKSAPDQPYGWVEIGNWRDTKHKWH